MNYLYIPLISLTLLTLCYAEIKHSLKDVDPDILGGDAKSGIRFRINPSGFKYANDLVAPLLSQQIRTLRIPKVEQCIEEVSWYCSREKVGTLTRTDILWGCLPNFLPVVDNKKIKNFC